VSNGQRSQRPGGRSALVRTRVHRAVLELLSERGVTDLSIPEVANRAGVNPTTIYRRWSTREGLIADAAIARLEHERPLPDTGALRTDLIAWARSAAAELAAPEGPVFLLALLASWPATEQAQAERQAQLQRRMQGLARILQRAAERGECPPEPGLVADAVLGPLYFRSMWGILPTDPEFPRALVERLLNGGT